MENRIVRVQPRQAGGTCWFYAILQFLLESNEIRQKMKQIVTDYIPYLNRNELTILPRTVSKSPSVKTMVRFMYHILYTDKYKNVVLNRNTENSIIKSLLLTPSSINYDGAKKEEIHQFIGEFFYKFGPFRKTRIHKDAIVPNAKAFLIGLEFYNDDEGHTICITRPRTKYYIYDSNLKVVPVIDDIKPETIKKALAFKYNNIEKVFIDFSLADI